MHFVKYHQLWLTSNVSTSCKVRFIKHTRLLVLVLEILYLPLTDRTHSPRYLYIKSLNPSLASLASEFTSMTCFFKFKEIWTLQTTQNPRKEAVPSRVCHHKYYESLPKSQITKWNLSSLTGRLGWRMDDFQNICRIWNTSLSISEMPLSRYLKVVFDVLTLTGGAVLRTKWEI